MRSVIIFGITMPNEPLPEWEALLDALKDFDGFYPQSNGQSVRQQLQIQLANPMPYDLDETNLQEYKKLRLEYQDWNVVAEKCREIASVLW